MCVPAEERGQNDKAGHSHHLNGGSGNGRLVVCVFRIVSYSISSIFSYARDGLGNVLLIQLVWCQVELLILLDK